jgi:hypothetical protein
MSSSPLDSFSACSASLASKRSDAVRPAALHACLNCLISRFRVTNAGESSLLPGSDHELTTQPGCDAKAEGHSHFQGKAVGDHNRDASGLFVPVRMPNVHVRVLTFVSAEEADEICLLPSRDPVKRRAQRAVQAAVRRGDLVRPERCERCKCVPPRDRDGRSTIVADHEDYAKPFDVTWLCHECHTEAHLDHTDPSAFLAESIHEMFDEYYFVSLSFWTRQRATREGSSRPPRREPALGLRPRPRHQARHPSP